MAGQQFDKNSRSVYQGTHGEDYMEHDCLRCGGSFDIYKDSVDRCNLCGSMDIVVRPGKNVNLHTLFSQGDTRGQHDTREYSLNTPTSYSELEAY